MLRRYTFKMYPNAGQEAQMFELRFLICQLYNAMVEQRRDAWDRCRKSIGKFDQGRECTLLRHADERYKAIGSKIMERCCERVDQAFKKYFDNVKAWKRGQWSKPFPPSPPRYQRTADFSGFGYREHPSGWKLIGGRVRMQGVNGTVRIEGRFPCEPEDVRTCDVMFRDGNWWISIVAKLPEKAAMRAATGRFYGAQPSNFSNETRVLQWIGPSDPSFVGGAQEPRQTRPMRCGPSDPSFVGGAQDGPGRAIARRRPSDPSFAGGAQGQTAFFELQGPSDPSFADIRLNLNKAFGTINGLPILLQPAKAAKGPRGAKNRLHRQALAIRRRDHAFHEFTTWIAETFDGVTVNRPRLKEVAQSGKGDAANHGAMVEWKAGINRDFLDWGAGKFCELLAYKMAERGKEFVLTEHDDAPIQVANEIVALAKESKRAVRIAKRDRKGAMRVPTQRNSSAQASNYPAVSGGYTHSPRGVPANVG